MVDTGVLSKDKWLGEYLQIFDGSEPHIVASNFQSRFLKHSGYCHDWGPFKDEFMEDMLVLGKLTIMLYREIHLHHFSEYFAREVEKVHHLCPNLLSGLIAWCELSSLDISLLDAQTLAEMGLAISIDMAANSFVRSIQKTVDDVRARAGA